MSKSFVFLAALVAGTVCSLSSKILMSMQSTGMTGETEAFSYPLFQTFGMFLGMTGGLLLHILVTYLRIPFPGYNHPSVDHLSTDSNHNDHDLISKPHPTWMYFVLIFPAVFDLLATCLAMYGLMYVTVSVYQMLRGTQPFLHSNLRCTLFNIYNYPFYAR